MGKKVSKQRAEEIRRVRARPAIPSTPPPVSKPRCPECNTPFDPALTNFCPRCGYPQSPQDAELQAAPRAAGPSFLARARVVAGLLALLFFPPVLGAVRVLLGMIAYARGDTRWGIAAAVVSVFCTGAGMVIGVAVMEWVQSARP